MGKIVTVDTEFGEIFLKNDGSLINLKVDVDHVAPAKSGGFEFDPDANGQPNISVRLDFLPAGQTVGKDKDLGMGALEVKVDIPPTALAKKFTVTVTVAGGKTPAVLSATGDGSAPGVDLIRYDFVVRFEVLPAAPTPVSAIEIPVLPAAPVPQPDPVPAPAAEPAPKPKRKPRRRKKKPPID